MSEDDRLEVKAARLAGYTQEAAEALVRHMRQQDEQERNYPRLLVEVERLRAENAALREIARWILSPDVCLVGPDDELDAMAEKARALLEAPHSQI